MVRGIPRFLRVFAPLREILLPPFISFRIKYKAVPPRIQPRTLKGFRDFLPELMLPREQIMDTARRVFRSYGFSPIDTPAHVL